MTSITFRRTNNLFINAGIVALSIYLREIRTETNLEYTFELREKELVIESPELVRLLEFVYYYMAKELYDTSGKNAREAAAKDMKYYFVDKPSFSSHAFPKMNNYGLARLITNNAQATPRKEQNGMKFKTLYESNKDFANQIGGFYHSLGLTLKGFDVGEFGAVPNEKQKKGDSQVFFNEPYTKITTIDFEKLDNKLFAEGDKICYLTGEGYKKLVDTTCTTPLISGLSSFNSHLSNSDKKISWKAMYLSRFSPKLCYYKYADTSLYVYFLQSDTLTNLAALYDPERIQRKDTIIQKDDYYSNFTFYNFGKEKQFDDYKGEAEVQFMLLYTFYVNCLKEKNIEPITVQEDDFDLFAEVGMTNIPISLVSFRADEFSSTMRPKMFEQYDNFKFLVQLIYDLENRLLDKQKVDMQKLLPGLRIISPKRDRDKNRYALERQLRNKIFAKFLSMRSIIDEMESLFYDAYRYAMQGAYTYRHYQTLLNFVIFYEQAINFGGHPMDTALQEKAVALGARMGQTMLNISSTSSKRANADRARKYLIDMEKSRNLAQLNDALIRIQKRYAVAIERDILDSINEKNCIYVKQFVLMSALNQINMVYSSKPKGDNNESAS